MHWEIVNLNAEVLIVRRLRAAAALPKTLALCCVAVALLVNSLEKDSWKACLALLCGGAFLLLLSYLIERGAAWAVWLLSALVLGLTLFFIVALILQVPHQDRLGLIQGATGAALILIPCWLLAALGLTGVWRQGKGKRQRARIRAITRSRWVHLPRDDRFRTALGSFAAAVTVYVGGLLPAALAAIAVGGHLLIMVLAYLPAARLAGRLWNRGRRQLAIRVQELRKLDTRPPILLLRSFEDDNLPLEKRHHFFWFLFTQRETLTLESFVVNQIWRLGPVLAIGNPRDDLSPLGAPREYVSDDDWQTHIRSYLIESAYVVCILGATPGLSWEYQQIHALGKQDRTLVVFPPRPFEELQRRWAILQRYFPPAASANIQWQPYIGAPLLALFSGSSAPVLFHCKFTNETAYSTAFSRLFEIVATPALERADN
jgi:hypothetical protein